MIPRSESSVEFAVTRDHAFAAYDTCDITQRDVITVHSAVPQELTMWENFAACVRKAQAGGGTDPHWPRIAALTQRVVCKVLESAHTGCATLPLA